MSKAKFAAAKEFIREKDYDQARRILKTIDHPTAREWMARLDRIDPPYIPPPPPPRNPAQQFHLSGASNYFSEQERYYRAENRSRRLRRIGTGIELIGAGVVCLVFFGFFGFFGKPVEANTIQLGLECFFVPLASICFIAGFLKITKRD